MDPESVKHELLLPQGVGCCITLGQEILPTAGIHPVPAVEIRLSNLSTGANISYFRAELEAGLLNNGSLTLVVQDQNYTLCLPESLAERFADYLRRPPVADRFDCISFVHDLFDAPYVYDAGFKLSDWKWRSFHEISDLKIGEVLILSAPGNPKERVTHTAIYLGEDLFLSRAGNGGAIMVAPLDVMKVLWGGEPKYVCTNFAPVNREITTGSTREFA
jgi:hypothetical protein